MSASGQLSADGLDGVRKRSFCRWRMIADTYLRQDQNKQLQHTVGMARRHAPERKTRKVRAKTTAGVPKLFHVKDSQIDSIISQRSHILRDIPWTPMLKGASRLGWLEQRDYMQSQCKQCGLAQFKLNRSRRICIFKSEHSSRVDFYGSGVSGPNFGNHWTTVHYIHNRTYKMRKKAGWKSRPEARTAAAAAVEALCDGREWVGLCR